MKIQSEYTQSIMSLHTFHLEPEDFDKLIQEYKLAGGKCVNSKKSTWSGLHPDFENWLKGRLNVPSELECNCLETIFTPYMPNFSDRCLVIQFGEKETDVWNNTKYYWNNNESVKKLRGQIKRVKDVIQEMDDGGWEKDL